MKTGYIHILVLFLTLALVPKLIQSKLLHEQTLDTTYPAALNSTQNSLNSSLVDAINRLKYIEKTLLQIAPNFSQNLSSTAPFVLGLINSVNTEVALPIPYKVNGCVNLTQEQNNTISSTLNDISKCLGEF